MRVTSLRMQNFRSFEDSGDIPLKQINVLIGANNAGKSTVLKALRLMQQGVVDHFADVRAGQHNAELTIRVAAALNGEWTVRWPRETDTFAMVISSSDRRSGGEHMAVYAETPPAEFSDFEKWRFLNSEMAEKSDAEIRDFLIESHKRQQREKALQRSVEWRFPNTTPGNYLVPFLARRKVNGFSEEVRSTLQKQVGDSMYGMAAMLQKLTNKSYARADYFAAACKEILGFEIGNISTDNGSKPGAYMPNEAEIFIDQMGEGVAQIVWMLCLLATSKGKLFLIEELENDLHPAALKALLDLILESSKDNQFVISTHSNIVVTHLCSQTDSQLLKVTSERGKLPTTSSIEVIPDDRAARMDVLRELGYAFSDFDLWEGWLLLEESSAETIIKNYLIPWFAPALKRVRTVSAAGVGNVEPIYKDLHRLVLFSHLESTRKPLTWVRVDGDEAGQQALEKLGKTFSLSGDQIKAFDQPQFENYYPPHFAEQAQQVLAITDAKAKKDAKEALLKQVRDWLDEDEERGKSALAASAQTVIEDLQAMKGALVTTP